MPIPKPNGEESKREFVSRCMSNPIMKKEYKDQEQRYAVCVSQFSNK
jgi:hypothetical protein